MRHGIRGQPAPAFRLDRVVDAHGHPAPPLTLASLGAHWRLLYCFQHWCRGCHVTGFPTLANFLDQARSGAVDVGVAVVQTVFEGFEENTFAAMLATQRRYGLGVAFAHDPGGGSDVAPSSILMQYRTGGTPWFILIDPHGKVAHDDYFLDPDEALAWIAGAGPA